MYESQESKYDYTWRSPLNHPPGRDIRDHLLQKYDFSRPDVVYKKLPEQKYQHWDLFLGDEKKEISDSWKTWDDSILGVEYDRPNSGPAGSALLGNRKIEKTYVS